jgi:RHS repeat-associated protein
VTISYVYDPLYRLKEANYSNGDYYHYGDDTTAGYDAVGNRLWQETRLNGVVSNTTYTYDDANRLTSVNGVTYTWDNNGNLLNDGAKTYIYDSANRLTTVNGPSSTVHFAYNGMGDRLQETANGQTTTFTMDLNMGLTQVLNDGTNNYIYGNGRIAQVNTDTEYFLGDALGSVRQLANESGAITYASAYDPYGVTIQAYGDSGSVYGYTGEYTDNEKVYLRARHYAPSMGRFLTRDTWGGDANIPITYNRWQYANANPVMYTDPSGRCIGPLALLCIGVPLVGAMLILSSAPSDTRILDENPAGELQFWSGVSLVSFKFPLAELAANTYDCANGFCDPSLMAPGSVTGYADAVDDIVAVPNPVLNDTLSPQAQAFLNGLPSPGSSVLVPTGQINSKIMAELQEYTGVEFALVRLDNGNRVLVRGLDPAVSGNFIHYPPGTIRIIAHTHPLTLSAIPTYRDFKALEQLGLQCSNGPLGQHSSAIITKFETRRFFASQDYWKNIPK